MSAWTTAVAALTAPSLWWRLGEASGTTLADNSGNSRAGTLSGSTITYGVTGPLVGDSDTAMSFTGTNPVGQVAYGSWAEATAFTVSCWIKTTSSATSVFVARDHQSNGRRFQVSMDTSGHVLFTVLLTTGSAAAQTSATYNDGNWHLITCVYDQGQAGTSKLKIYMDGSSTPTLSGTTPGFTINTTGTGVPFSVGNTTRTASTPANGSVDEVIYWAGTALTGANHVSLYTAGTTNPDGNVSAVAATATATAQVPTVTGIRNATVAAVAAAATAAALAPSLVGTANVAPPAATATADALPPVVLGSGGANVDATTATATATALAPSVSATQSPTVAAVTATATATALAPTVFTGLNAEVLSPAATATAVAWPPTVVAEQNVALTASNRAGGRHRSGRGVASWEPPVAPVPTRVTLGLRHPRAQAFGVLTWGTEHTQPAFEVTEASGAMTRDRIVVGGKDVTFFRDTPTPPVDYQLVEPFLYGPATLRLPQVAAAFEKPGVGALAFARIGNAVKMQRVNLVGEVVSTDWRGFITAYDVDGGDLVLQLGGKVTGLMAMREQQLPLFNGSADIGRLVFHAFESVGVPFSPRLGPETGVEMNRFGGMTLLDYTTAVLARGTTRTGNEFTVMPDDDGVYSMFRKDTETVDFTVYVDDARTKASLRRDMTAEPNRIFGVGTTKGGQRVKNGVYPGLLESQEAPYPFDDGHAFGLGTTNADTDTGDGISVMLARLQTFGLMNRSDVDPGEFDEDAEAAIARFQDEEALPVVIAGQMNPGTWDALFNLNVTGSSIWWSRVEPMASLRPTRKWKRTADGSIRGKNPTYDPTLIKVDRNIDFGAGFKRQQMFEWARAELDAANDPNYVGTIVFGLGGVIEGDWDAGDPLTVMDARDIKPGMNVKVIGSLAGPGGQVLHVSGVDVSDGTVTATVDSRARDTLPVWEVIRRNREARQDPALLWFRQNRSSTEIKDAVIEFDEIGGRINPVPVTGGEWKVFRVLVGEVGMIERFRMKTTADEAAYVVAVFGLPIGKNKLADAVPNPLADKSNWTNETIRRALDTDHRLLYVAGEPDSPCGYFPGSLVDGGDITGRWEDDASFAYRTGERHPFVYVAVYADRDCTVEGGANGRIFWNQEVVGS